MRSIELMGTLHWRINKQIYNSKKFLGTSKGLAVADKRVWEISKLISIAEIGGKSGLENLGE